jgi:hypothetical protein
MTEPVTPSAAERLAALRAPSKDRGSPAHAWKVLAGGMTTSAMFGLIAAMGWGGTAQSTALPPDTAVQIVPSAPLTTFPVATIPATTIPVTTVPPAVVIDEAPEIPVVPVTEPPTTVAPETIPVAVRETIPVAVPVPQAQPTQRKATKKVASNTATKSSG